MTLEEANTSLYHKMFAEQQAFCDRLLTLEPKEILKNAYELVMREDILLCLEYHDLTQKQCCALLKSDTPLADVFREWEHTESAHMEEIRNIIEHCADETMRKDTRKSRSEVR